MKRLVTYYDESQGESDKSRYVYNRVGDFPIVQLKKTEIKRNVVKSSSRGIAPPSKTVLNRDIRAAIMRSNSFQLSSSVPKLMPTKMRAKDDSHQIITNHDPLPIDESLQTAKSVLDALEKNCRKRINNEELTMDRNKRVCATNTLDVADAPSPREFAPIAPQSVKRNREQASPDKTKAGDSPTDQIRKKLRMKNNALMCSLSSSQFILKPYNVKPSPPLPVAAKSLSSPAMTSQQPSKNDVIEPLKETTSAPKMITPMEKKDSDKKQEVPVKRLHLFNRKFDPSDIKLRPKPDDDDDDDSPKINFVKPREKSQNENFDIVRHIEQDKLKMMLSGLSDGFSSPTKELSKDSVDAAAPAIAASISFTTSTTSSSSTPISTAAMVLSPGITSPTIVVGALTKPVETSEKTPVTTSAPSAVTTSAPKTLPSFQFGSAVQSQAPTTTSSAMPTLIVASTVSTTSAVTTAPLALFTSPGEAKSIATPLIDPSKSLITFTPIAKPNVAPTVAATTTTQPVFSSSLTSTGGIKFGVSTVEAPKTTSSFNFGGGSIGFGSTTAPSMPSIPVVSSAPSLVTSAPSFSFPAASTNAFSFGAKPATSTVSAMGSGISGVAPISINSGNLGSTVSFLQKPETTTASGVGFSFQNTTSTVPAMVPAPTTTASSGFSFGSSQSTPASNITATPATTASSFSFGASSNTAFGQPSAPSAFTGFAPKAAAQPAPDMFSFTQTTAPAPVTSSSTFSFGGSSQTPAAPSNGFSFGQTNPVAPAPVQPSAAPGIFSRLGGKQPEQAAKSTFSFGASNQNQPSSTPLMFGNSNVPQPVNAPNMFGSNGPSAFNQAPASGNNLFANNQTNTFGGNSKSAGGNLFAFGSTNSSNIQPVQPTPTPQNPSAFSFGSSSATSPPSASSNMFGGSVGSNVSASFTFKPSTGTVSNNSAPNMFGQNQNQSSGPPPAYQFGNQPSNNVSTSFTFGGASNSANAPAPSSGFNFGGPQSAPTQGANFNFQGAQQQQQPSLTPQPGGVFSIGTGGNQQRRPMRQATRRMK